MVRSVYSHTQNAACTELYPALSPQSGGWRASRWRPRIMWWLGLCRAHWPWSEDRRWVGGWRGCYHCNYTIMTVATINSNRLNRLRLHSSWISCKYSDKKGFDFYFIILRARHIQENGPINQLSLMQCDAGTSWKGCRLTHDITKLIICGSAENSSFFVAMIDSVRTLWRLSGLAGLWTILSTFLEF